MHAGLPSSLRSITDGDPPCGNSGTDQQIPPPETTICQAEQQTPDEDTASLLPVKSQGFDEFHTTAEQPSDEQSEHISNEQCAEQGMTILCAAHCILG